MMVSSVNRSVSSAALLQQSCSILTEERLFPGSGYLSTAQDIQNVAYAASNCQNQSATVELSHIGLLHLFFCNLITVAAGQSN